MPCEVCGREFGAMVIVKDGKCRHLLCRQCAGLTEDDWLRLCEKFHRSLPEPIVVGLRLTAERRVLLKANVVPFESKSKRVRQARRSQKE